MQKGKYSFQELFWINLISLGEETNTIHIPEHSEKASPKEEEDVGKGV